MEDRLALGHPRVRSQISIQLQKASCPGRCLMEGGWGMAYLPLRAIGFDGAYEETVSPVGEPEMIRTTKGGFHNALSTAPCPTPAKGPPIILHCPHSLTVGSHLCTTGVAFSGRK